MASARKVMFATNEGLTDMEEKLKVGLLQLIEINFFNYMSVNYMGFYKCSKCVLFIHT
jgi:hypothetical protein